MTRSVWKGPFFDESVVKKVEHAKKINSQKPIRIWSRRSTILPEFIGFVFEVYNGKKFIPVVVREEMIGHKFGEFSPTRTFKGHSGDKKARR